MPNYVTSTHLTPAKQKHKGTATLPLDWAPIHGFHPSAVNTSIQSGERFHVDQKLHQETRGRSFSSDRHAAYVRICNTSSLSMSGYDASPRNRNLDRSLLRMRYAWKTNALG